MSLVCGALTPSGAFSGGCKGTLPRCHNALEDADLGLQDAGSGAVCVGGGDVKAKSRSKRGKNGNQDGNQETRNAEIFLSILWHSSIND